MKPFTKKSLFSLILILCLPFLLFACTGKSNPGQDIPDETSPPLDELIEPEFEPEPMPEPPAIPNPLTGEPLGENRHLIAIMVNNVPKARPQTGLGSADLVYEIEMEGAVTRFLAFFYGELPEDVGSVRSARPYVMMLAKEWDAYFAHVGGSNDAFAKVTEWGIKDIDDTRGHTGFWVNTKESRPHNTYLNLKRALSGKKVNGVFHKWVFKKPLEITPEYREIRFSYDQFNRPSYVFSEEDGLYRRFVNGDPHIDFATGNQIKTRNIIVQYAKHKNLNDKLLHIEVDLVGEGKAEYFLGGKYQEGTWKKKDYKSPTEYLDNQGKPIVFVEGKTWVQVVRHDREVKKQ